MAGRLGHIDGARRVGHVPRNGIRVTEYRYGFGNCIFHLKADHVDNPVNLGAVSKITDSVLGRTFVQGTDGNKPRFIASSANFNGFPSLQFHDNNRRMTLPFGYLAWGVNNTLVMVAKVDTQNTFNMVFGDSETSANSGFHFGGSLTSLNGIGFNLTNLLMGFADGTEDTAPHIVILNKDFIIVDGTVYAWTFWGSTTPASMFVFGINQLGSNRNNAASCLRGEFREALIYDSVFDSDDGLKLSSILNSEYAIY
jgi:hypothetical protein